MRFGWTEEQDLLRSMLERYVAERHAFDPHRVRRTTGVDRAAWRELAELGVLGLPFAEAEGGSGGTALDVLLTMQAFGRGLVRLPYLSAIVLAGGLLRHAGSADQKVRHLQPLIAGEQVLAFAYGEPQSRTNPADVATTAGADGDGFVLDGTKSVTLGAPEADFILVTARTAGGQRDEAGISLFLVPANAVDMRPFATIDGQSAAEITLSAVRVTADALVGPLGEAVPIVRRVLDEATMAICADAIGAMAALNDKCLEHVRTRHAFGQPLAGFQALQHRLVDMRVSYEMAAAITLKAATLLADGSPAAPRAVAACKALVSEEAAFVGKTAVQLHGAIGITEELDIGHYFKRLTAMQLAFGTADHHLRRCIAIDRAAQPTETAHGH